MDVLIPVRTASEDARLWQQVSQGEIFIFLKTAYGHFLIHRITRAGESYQVWLAGGATHLLSRDDEVVVRRADKAGSPKTNPGANDLMRLPPMERVYKFLCIYAENNLRPSPSRRVIARECRLSTGEVAYYLKELEQEGRLIRTARGVKLVSRQATADEPAGR